MKKALLVISFGTSYAETREKISKAVKSSLRQRSPAVIFSAPSPPA